MIKRTKEMKKNILKWTKELRSGKYEQVEGVLQGSEKGFCCLGVACKLFIPKSELRLNKHSDWWYGTSGEDANWLDGDLPDEQTFSPEWLTEINDDFENRTGISLAVLNDGARLPKTESPIDFPRIYDNFETRFDFNEIADLIEAVYVHGALD